MFVPVPEIRTATRAFVMTLSPQSVRAELVEALFCLSTSKEKERPFDKLRANGERSQPWYVALHAAIALPVSDPPSTVQPFAPFAIWPQRCNVSPAAWRAALTPAGLSGAPPPTLPQTPLQNRAISTSPKHP